MQDTPQNRYRRKNLWILSIALNRATEPELVEHVKRQDNKQGYIKSLIRADMAKTCREGCKWYNAELAD